MGIEMPLFPLNSVLFPNMPFPLHIFEERYKEMIGLCVQEKRPFGIVLIREGQAEGGPVANPHDIGCTANIVNVQMLQEGRMLIMTTGGERFRINQLYHDRPYVVGDVELIPANNPEDGNVVRWLKRLHPFVVDYLDVLANLGKVDFDKEQIPKGSRDLGYLAASIIQIPHEDKQALLEENEMASLLQELYKIYREEVSLLKLMPPQDKGAVYVN